MGPYLLIAALWITGVASAKSLDIKVVGEEAILMNAKTGQVLFAKNEHQPAYPASTTKIATALYALHTYPQSIDLLFTAERESVASITPEAKRQSNYRSPPYWLETDGSHIGIKKGEELRLKDLLRAMLINSANDASNVIAQGIGGSIPAFMEEVNIYLKKIGCQNTHYNNPHGLHHPSHTTTAYDLAVMTKEALKEPLFREIVSLVRYTCPKTNLEQERHLVQTNQLLKRGPFFYPKAIGVKTGFTQRAGKNLVAAAQEGDRILIAVALGYKGPRAELYQDIVKMFDAGFEEHKMRRTVLNKGEQKLTVSVVGANKQLKTYLTEDLHYDFYPSEETPIRAAISWQVPHLPIKQGTCVGKIKIIDEHATILGELPLLALEELKPTLRHSLSCYISEKHLRVKGMVGLIVGLMSYVFWKILRKSKISKRSRSFR